MDCVYGLLKLFPPFFFSPITLIIKHIFLGIFRDLFLLIADDLKHMLPAEVWFALVYICVFILSIRILNFLT